MIFTQNDTIYNKANLVNFTARNSLLRKADDVSRRVIHEFPVLSNSRLLGYETISESNPYLSYARNLVCEYRKYYKEGVSPKKIYYRELYGMKELKTGNCAELADATFVALKLNGVEDVKRLNLYAYNTKTKSMRDLDHTVIGVNFELPKKYKYHQWIISENYVKPECRIYPQNSSIIVDSWSGFTEYAKQAGDRFKSDKALIESNKKGIYRNLETLLDKDEELCYLPLEDFEKFNKRDYDYFGQTYPDIVLDKNKAKVSQKDVTQKRAYRVSKPHPLLKDELKHRFGLKGAITDDELQVKKQEYIDSVKEKYGLNKAGGTSGGFDILGKLSKLAERIFN